MITVSCPCKICGKTFSYTEESVALRVEDGESRPERCPECRETHAEEFRELVAPYIIGRRVGAEVSVFAHSPLMHTYRGQRRRQLKANAPDPSGMNLGIRDEDVIELYEKLERHQVVVVVSQTGSGKSTFIPARLLLPPPGYDGHLVEQLMRQGQIIITQPRIPAVQNIPTTIASKYLGSDVGPDHGIGYRHGSRHGKRQGEQWSRYNQAVVVTDGSLRNWIREGHIGRYSLVMVDEAHERSVNIDVILGLLKTALRKHRHLRVIISSATINKDAFVSTFREVGIPTDLLEIPDRKETRYYGPHFRGMVEALDDCDCWLCALPDGERSRLWSGLHGNLLETTARFTRELVRRTRDGSVLMFLHGKGPIERTADLMREDGMEGVPVIPVYSGLKEREVVRRLKQSADGRRVVVATNVAETSLTLPDVVYVIDSGLIKQSQWDPVRRAEVLRATNHSRDGCRQRWGRAGRVRDGYVYTLYTEEEFADDEAFPEHTAPEIVRSRLDDALLTASASGISDLNEFRWVDAPDPAEIRRAHDALRQAAAVDSDGDITETSLELLRIPRPSTEAAVLLRADIFGCLFEALSVLLAASTRDGTSRIGEDLYDDVVGLLVWDSDWSALEKAKAWCVHEAFRVGCQDDVAFLTELVERFARAKESEEDLRWCVKNYANHEVLSGILDERERLVQQFGERSRDHGRRLRVDRLSLLRRLLRTLAPDAPLFVVPESEEKSDQVAHMACDRTTPIGSWVSVVVAPGSEVATGTTGAASFRTRWLGQEVRERGRVVGWTEDPEGPLAELSVFGEEEEQEEVQGLAQDPTVGVSAVLKMVGRDPDARDRDLAGGWGVLVCQKGVRFSLELEDLSLTPRGPGLERVVGATVDLRCPAVTEATGDPRVSTLDSIVEDLEVIVGQGTARVPGFVEGVSSDGKRLVVSAPRDGGVVHSFEVHEKYVPRGGPSAWNPGDEVELELSPTPHEAYRAGWLVLTEEEEETLPLGLSYDRAQTTLSFPYRLKMETLRTWRAREEVLGQVWRLSWRYSVQARVIDTASLERLAGAQRGQTGMTGRVAKLLRDGAILVTDDVGFTVRVDKSELPLALRDSGLAEGEEVVFWVKSVDAEKEAVAASLVDPREYKVGRDVSGEVQRLKEFGAFVLLDIGGVALIRVREMRTEWIDHPRLVLSEGDRVGARIIEVSEGGQKVALSLLKRETVWVPADQIGKLIGTRGRDIRRLQETTGTRLDVQDHRVRRGALRPLIYQKVVVMGSTEHQIQAAYDAIRRIAPQAIIGE